MGGKGEKTKISPFPATHSYIKLTLVSLFSFFFAPFPYLKIDKDTKSQNSSGLPNPIVVRINGKTCNLSFAITELQLRVGENHICVWHSIGTGSPAGEVVRGQNLFQLMYNHKLKSNAPLKKNHKTADRKGSPT